MAKWQAWPPDALPAAPIAMPVKRADGVLAWGGSPH